MNEKKKYCKHCGELIDDDCVVCPKCGKQVEQLASNNRDIIINNSASSSASSAAVYKTENAMVSKLVLDFNIGCLFWRNILDCWNYNEIKLEIT